MPNKDSLIIAMDIVSILDNLPHYPEMFLGSMIKFVTAPILGSIHGVSVTETALITTIACMTSVGIVLLVGENAVRKLQDKLRFRKSKNVKKQANKHRRINYIWKRYGILGIAFLTPMLFTPIGGTLIALSLRVPRRTIFSYMFLSAFFWSFILSFVFHLGGEQLLG